MGHGAPSALYPTGPVPVRFSKNPLLKPGPWFEAVQAHHMLAAIDLDGEAAEAVQPQCPVNLDATAAVTELI